MRRSSDGTCWAHPTCVMFPRELSVNPDDDWRLVSLAAADPDRGRLTCRLCRRKGKGLGCVQCAFGDCMIAAHPYCALCTTEDYLLLLWEHRPGQKEETRYDLYCPLHRQAAPSAWKVIASSRPLTNASVDSPSARNDNNKRLSFTQLVDSAEKDKDKDKDHYDPLRVPSPKLKRLRRANDNKRDEAATRKKKRRRKREQRVMLVGQYFELQAEESSVDGSVSPDDEDNEEEEEEQLSGDFINDGEYTQHNDNDNDDDDNDGYSFYAALHNHQRLLADSPQAEDILQGRVSIGRLVRGRRANRESRSPGTHLLPGNDKQRTDQRHGQRLKRKQQFEWFSNDGQDCDDDDEEDSEEEESEDEDDMQCSSSEDSELEADKQRKQSKQVKDQQSSSARPIVGIAIQPVTAAPVAERREDRPPLKELLSSRNNISNSVTNCDKNVVEKSKGGRLHKRPAVSALARQMEDLDDDWEF